MSEDVANALSDIASALKTGVPSEEDFAASK